MAYSCCHSRKLFYLFVIILTIPLHNLIGNWNTFTVAQEIPSFDEWELWPSQISTCNSTKNKNLSPININTNNTITDKTIPTLFVYSSTPITYYVLSLEFEDEDHQIFMNTLHLKLDGDHSHEATYVTGLGDVSYRFFQYAVFLFSKNNTNPRLSLHQIDSRTFPMEIVLFFSTKRTLDDTTQVHVLVNISEAENPLFIPIVNTVKEIKLRQESMKENMVKGIEAQTKYGQMESNWTERTKSHGNVYQTVDVLKNVIQKVERYDSTIQHIQTELDKEVEMKNQIDSRINKLKDIVDKNKAELKSLVTKIKKLMDKFKKMKEAEIVQNAQEVNDMEETGVRLESDLLAKNRSIASLEERKASYEKKIQHFMKQIETNNNEIMGTFEVNNFADLKSLSDAKTLLNSSLLVVEEDKAEKEAMKAQEDLGKKYMDLGSMLVSVGSFQASWLLPATGGHYMYNGSSPIPPCTKRGFTIVMEQPVFISQKQFDGITAAGDIKGFGEPMRESVPILADIGDRKVIHNKKNLQFILDDGVHMKSKTRKRLKDAMLKSMGNHIIWNWVLPAFIAFTAFFYFLN